MLRSAAFKDARLGRAAVWMVGIALLIAALVMVGLLSLPAHAASITFTVNRTGDQPDADTADNACDRDLSTPGNRCTLRAAIEQANANGNVSEVDRIKFNIKGAGVHTISPGLPLPVIIDPLIINGYSQLGSSDNTLAKGTNANPLIEITPTAGFASVSNKGGLTVGAPDSAVKGLVINGFPAFMPGIEVSAFFSGKLLTNVRIEGNFLGTDPSGTIAEGNGGPGVQFVGASDSTIGGTSLASRNLISGNNLEGVFIRGGTSLGRDPANNNLVRGNLIGTQKDGIKPLGNGSDGLSIIDSAASFPDGTHDANGNSILSNSIFSNGAIGIDLLGDDGPNTNDAGDTDAGPNRLQNKPVLSSAKTVSGTTTVKGTLNSRPTETYTVQFFSSPSGNQGRTFLGSKIVKTDASDKASFTFSPSGKVAAGQRVTATATRTKTGDTSEFSAPRTVGSS
jgi:hypothetical protein